MTNLFEHPFFGVFASSPDQCKNIFNELTKKLRCLLVVLSVFLCPDCDSIMGVNIVVRNIRQNS